MTTRVRVLRCVLVRRAVATTCSATLLARAQVKPAITGLHTVFTNPLFWLLNVSNLVDMNAYFCRHPASIQPADAPRSVALWTDSRNLYQAGHPSLLKVHRGYHRHE